MLRNLKGARRLALAAGLLAVAVAPSARSATDGAYARYELLDPASSSVRITDDVSATTAGATLHVHALIACGEVSDVAAIDRMTGQPLKFEVAGGKITVQLARPVPRGGETRLRILETCKDPKSYAPQGDLIAFSREPGTPQASWTWS